MQDLGQSLGSSFERDADLSPQREKKSSKETPGHRALDSPRMVFCFRKPPAALGG